MSYEVTAQCINNTRAISFIHCKCTLQAQQRGLTEYVMSESLRVPCILHAMACKFKKYSQMLKKSNGFTASYLYTKDKLTVPLRQPCENKVVRNWPHPPKPLVHVKTFLLGQKFRTDTA